MRPVYRNGVQVSSARLLAALQRSHTVATRADVLFDRVVIATGLPLVSGSITYDRNAAVLASGTAVFAETDVSLGPSDPLTPFGYEVQIWAGASFPDADDIVSMGVFPIQQTQVAGIGLSTTVTLLDRAQLVIDARFEDDYAIAAGTNYADAIEALITDGVNDLEYVFTSTTFTTPLLVFDSQSDRWEAAQSMARSIGCELFFDGLGRCVLQPEPDVVTITASIDVVEGEGGVLVDAALALDRAPAFNKVIAFSENASTGDQYRGEATDSDPSSPTYYLGPFGKKPHFFGSPFLTSNAQCDTAAAAILASNLGVARSLNFDLVPNPVVEPSDGVLLTRTALDINEIQLIDKYTFGLGAAGTMRCDTRAKQVVS